MSWQQATEPSTDLGRCHGLATVISPRPRDLGGFEVRRVLPSPARRSVGPFVFWDQMGPAALGVGRGIDVRPHPHIGLATITYLFEGEIMHRDSLGSEQVIRPGEVNWMTAGRGIVHSERTPPALRTTGSALSGIQAWVALPRAQEETEPSFVHHPAADLPLVEGTASPAADPSAPLPAGRHTHAGDGVRVRVLVGSIYGRESPVRAPSPMFYADAALRPGASLRLPAEHEERAIHVAAGRLRVADETFSSGQLLAFRPGDEIVVTAEDDARILLLGGAPLDGPRHVWWNFVSSSQERIEQAKADWKGGRFPPVPYETEFIPLPDR
jgi:redox-sensitive bicupin YhaK (pirin superfamily)